MTLRLGTRGSALALAQSRSVADALRTATGREVELVEIVTPGDRSAAPIQQIGVGVFVSALRDAVLAKEIDFAVHSYKDLPSAPAPGLCIAAVPQRADPRDALVARDGLTLGELPAGSVVGTGAVRRIAQLHALGRQLDIRPIRGNVDTRLRKVADGQLDAVVVARAGLDRLGRQGDITETLDPLLMLPAPAQGALAVECREDLADIRELLALLDDPMSRVAVTAERSLLAALQAGCNAPVAAFAVIAEGEPPDPSANGDAPSSSAEGGPVSPTAEGKAEGKPVSSDADGAAAGRDEIYLRGAVISLDGSFAVRLSRIGTPADAVQIGQALAADLLAAGADHLLAPEQPGGGSDVAGSAP